MESLSNWTPKLAEYLPTKGLSRDNNGTIETDFVTKIGITCVNQVINFRQSSHFLSLAVTSKELMVSA